MGRPLDRMSAKEETAGMGGCCSGKKKADDGEPESKKPGYTRITQQELGACKPVLTKAIVTLVFLTVTLTFIPIGVVCLIYGMRATEVTYRYDGCTMAGQPGTFASNAAKQQFMWNNAGNAAALTCNFQIPITADMNGPIYVYYEIKGLYQNHRRYVRSHIDLQLAGQSGWAGYVGDETQAQSCVPLVNVPNSNPSLQINPCGLVAWSYFNDTYEVALRTRSISAAGPVSLLVPQKISSEGISFQSDITYRFANYTPTNFNANLTQWGGGGNITGTPKQDQRFQVWMRLSHMAHFRKLWGVWEGVSLKAGDSVNVTVVNQYNTYSFDGTKSIVLSTTTWLGGHSIFLGVAYLITGGVSLIFAVAYLFITLLWPRKFADTSRLHKSAVAGFAK